MRHPEEPGHHFQVALQLENESLHPYRRNAYFGAFTEGWAEYASSLGEEMGLFEDPYDRYGRLIMEIFLASRLVVDTGMGHLGWSLEEAREYMRDHVFQSETQIATETLRYATRPGQALAYRIDYEKIWELRRKAAIGRLKLASAASFESVPTPPGWTAESPGPAELSMANCGSSGPRSM